MNTVENTGDLKPMELITLTLTRYTSIHPSAVQKTAKLIQDATQAPNPTPAQKFLVLWYHGVELEALFAQTQGIGACY